MSAPDAKRQFAVEVVRTLAQAGFTALWAGGCVRDFLLGRPPDDYDVATNARPDQVQAVFGPRRTRAIGASFGVILVHAPRHTGGGDVEVATFRTEGPYLDGRHPEHVSFATPEEDAHRRDFTINGMFYDPLAEQVLDYVGGREDLTNKVVRAIGDPHARFGEDKLRMLRAVRISARFDFELDAKTAQAVRAQAPEILVVSQERIAQELKKMLVHPRRARAISLAHDVQLLTKIMPELAPVIASIDEPSAHDRWRATLRMLELLDNPRFELALAALLHEAAFEGPPATIDVEQLCRRLRLSNDECHDVSWLVEHRDALQGVADWRKSRLKRLLAEPLIGELILLARTYALATEASLADVEFCEQYLSETPLEDINPPPLITGDDLKHAGISPGPQFKQLLDQVRDAQLEGTIKTQDEAIALVRRILGMS
ncbi:MAG TPA: CCA tRNA nucleotidyltransferase [Planctomycetaceae bacterium]